MFEALIGIALAASGLLLRLRCQAQIGHIVEGVTGQIPQFAEEPPVEPPPSESPPIDVEHAVVVLSEEQNPEPPDEPEAPVTWEDIP